MVELKMNAKDILELLDEFQHWIAYGLLDQEKWSIEDCKDFMKTSGVLQRKVGELTPCILKV